MLSGFIEQVGTDVPKYKPYISSRGEKLIDGIIGFFAPERARKRLISREKISRWRYLSSLPNGIRKNASPTTVGGSDTQRGDAERRQIMWNAIEQVENSGLAVSIRDKLVSYICGTIRYQARTGDKTVNTEYESYILSRLGRQFDISGQRTGRQMFCTGMNDRITKGDWGLNLVREGNQLYGQGIGGDRIGNPYDYRASQEYVGGVTINPRTGAHLAYDIFQRERMSGLYRFDVRVTARTEILRLPNFLFSANRDGFDEVRGRSVFSTTLDNVAYIQQIRDYELQALAWAASQSGVFHTQSGNMEDLAEFQNLSTDTDVNGNQMTRFTVRPNTVTALGIGEDITMFQHDRPSPNVVAMYKNTIRDIAIGCKLSYGFVYDMTGLNGPGVRYHSTQDKRSIDRMKADLKDEQLSPLIIILLMEGIDNGEIPYHPQWTEHAFLFPPHPTIDAGRESAANINENLSALLAGADIVGEDGRDIEEVQAQCGRETENLIEIAMGIAKRKGLNWREVYGFLRAGKTIQMSPLFESARADNMDAQTDEDKRSEDRATSEGSDLP